MVQFIRELLYYFMLDHKDLTITGLKLDQIIIGDASSLEDYCENIVRKMGEEARSLLISILPSILRINIYTVVLDTHAKSSVLLY